MDPGLPSDSDEFKSKGIWPELRRAEANRFAVMLKNAVAKKQTFDSVRVVPDKSAHGHIYVEGEITKSNGEDLHLVINVTDIAGKKRMQKTYRHRVKKYDLENPRSAGADLYTPLFDKIAGDLASLHRKIKKKDRKYLDDVEELLFAKAFSAEYFSPYLSVSNLGKTKVLSLPDSNDPMLKRVKTLRIRDQMFIDNIQVDYDRFRAEMDKDYLGWQSQAFIESKAARDAQSAAAAKAIFGTLLTVGGIAVAAKAETYDPALYGGIAAAAVGARVVMSGIESSRDAKAHRESMSELGRSLNIQIAPRVMELEDKEIKLEGTARQQYLAWRLFLKDFYQLESTPNVSL